MADLTKFLKDQDYDLIDGPVRNQRPLQLWLKKGFEEPELYYAEAAHAFTSAVVLQKVSHPALSVNASQKDEYGFNIGITLVNDLLKALGMGAFSLSTKINSGKKVVISYDNSTTEEYPTGQIEEFFATADFKVPNNQILRNNANRNNILIIVGTVFAKNLNVSIETDFAVEANLVADLNKIANGKLDFTSNSKNHLQMTSSGNMDFPIAVRASRLAFANSKFRGLKSVDSNIF